LVAVRNSGGGQEHDEHTFQVLVVEVQEDDSYMYTMLLGLFGDFGAPHMIAIVESFFVSTSQTCGLSRLVLGKGGGLEHAMVVFGFCN